MKTRVKIVCVFGCFPIAANVLVLNQTFENLSLRMRQHYKNARKAGECMAKHSEVDCVDYPGLNKY